MYIIWGTRYGEKKNNKLRGMKHNNIVAKAGIIFVQLKVLHPNLYPNTLNYLPCKQSIKYLSIWCVSGLLGALAQVTMSHTILLCKRGIHIGFYAYQSTHCALNNVASTHLTSVISACQVDKGTIDSLSRVGMHGTHTF